VSVRYSLLALLSEARSMGLQLREEFETSAGHVWPLNVGGAKDLANCLGELDGVGHIHGNGWHRGSPPAWSSIAGAGGCPAGERDDAAAVGAGVAELLVFQGELVDGADEGGDVGAELGEFLVLAAIVCLSRAMVARSLSPTGWGTCAAWLSRASARSRSWVACWSVRAMLPQPGTQWSRLGVSFTPSRWHRARSRL